MTYIEITDVEKLKRGDLAKFQFPDGSRIDGFVAGQWTGYGDIEIDAGPVTAFIAPQHFVSAKQNVEVKLRFRQDERVELLPEVGSSRGTIISPQSIAAMFNASPNWVTVEWDEQDPAGQRISRVPESLLRSLEEDK